MTKIISWIGVLLLVWGVKFAVNVISDEPILSDEEYAAEWIADDNAWVEEEIADGSAVDASGWLDHAKHATFEADPKQVDGLIDRFEAAGAVQVWMIGVESFGGKQLSDSIAVELPSDPTARARLFQIEADFWDGDETQDLGQRYLVMSLGD